MAKKTNVLTEVKGIETAPSGFAGLNIQEKFLTVLNMIKDLQPTSGKNTVNKKSYQGFISLIEEAAKTNNFDIDENGKVFVNILTPENRAKAEEVVNLLESDNIKAIEDLNNLDALIEELKATSSAQETLAKTNSALNEKIAELETSIKTSEDQINQTETILVETLGKDIKDIREEVKEHNTKNPDDQVSTLVYMSRLVNSLINEQQVKMENSNKTPTKAQSGKFKNLLIAGLALSTIVAGVGAGYHATRQNQLEKELEEKNVVILDKDNEINNFGDIIIGKDQIISGLEQDINDQQSVIDSQNKTIAELQQYQDKFNTIKEGLEGAGYSYITEDTINLEGLIDDLGDEEYSKETQEAYANFIKLLEAQGIEIEGLMTDGKYDQTLVDSNVEPIINAAISHINNLVNLDGKLDDVFNKLDLTDENGNEITLNTFENREQAYTYITNYINQVYSSAFDVLDNLDENATKEDYVNALDVIEAINAEVGAIQKELETNKAEYDKLSEMNDLLADAVLEQQTDIEELKQEISKLEEEIEELKNKGDSQGDVNQNEQESNTNQTVSNGSTTNPDEQESGDKGTSNGSGKREDTQENENGL